MFDVACVKFVRARVVVRAVTKWLSLFRSVAIT
jgi:hypothetical protein